MNRKTEKAFILEFNLEEAKYFKGNIFIHNHPGASSFSYDDIDVMIRYKMKEMRVIGTDYQGNVHRYIMKPITPGIYPNGVKVWKDCEVVFKKRYSHYEKIYFDGKIQWPDAAIKLGNEVWIEVAKKNKELIYISEVI